jgi:nucleoid DNA-binding protein
MTKAEVVKEIHGKVSDLTKAQVEAVLDAISEVAAQELVESQEFSLPGVVKITVKSTAKRPQRVGRNPQTGEEIVIPEKPEGKKLKATFAKALRDEVIGS